MTSSSNDNQVTEEKLGCKKKCAKWSRQCLKDRVPFLEWFPKYEWRNDFLKDFSCGFTLACIHVPQALAFSMLANVDLIYGLYTTAFTGIIYTFLGTAHISSYGPVAVGSMITGEAVSLAANHGFSNNEVATTLTFLIGLVYLIAFIFRLGVITVIFRKNFISPFICGCTCHILAKSLKMLFGLKIKNHYGLFNFPYNLYYLGKNIHLTNYWTLGVSVVVLSIFLLNMFVLKPFVRRFTKCILPIEAITMLLASLVSYLCSFKDKGVPIVGYVPSGLPEPSLPNFDIFPLIISSAVTTALINFSSSISMSFLFNKNVKPGQELFSMAVANLVCANFQCITVGNSMMRTRVAVTLGMRTLMSTLIASLLIVLVILFAGPVFTPMPTAVLGCVIVLSTALLLFDRFKEMIPLVRKSFEDALMYFIILSVTLFADVMFGLLVGFILSLRRVLLEVPDEQSKSLKSPPVEEKESSPEMEELLNTKNGNVQIVPKNQKLNV